MTVICRVQRFAEALPEILPLIDPHWAEVGSFKDQFRQDINFLAYQQLDVDGRLLTVTARQNSQLIGYFIGGTGFDVHRVTLSEPSTRVKMLTALVYYVCPEKRGHAPTLIRAVEREAEALGVQVINVRVKPGLNAAEAFFDRMGYSTVEITKTRLIGEAARHVRDRRPKVA